MGNWVLLSDYVDYDNLSIENFNELEGVDDAVPEKGQYGLHYGLAVVIDLEEGKYFAPENVEAAMADKNLRSLSVAAIKPCYCLISDV